MALPEVQIELYEKGKGPRHTFKTRLQGWDANRLDLETIQNTYKLNAVYAYSISGGRGHRLAFHPRNGLSVVCYSGKPNVVIRLDSDPKTPVTQILFRLTLGLLLACLVILMMNTDLSNKFKELRKGSIGWSIALVMVVVVGTQAIAWSFRRKR